MLVFWRQNLVLLSVPKTGTTSLEDAFLPHASAAILRPPQKKHVTARRFQSDLAPFFQERDAPKLEYMALVREPVAWLGSWYRYRSRPAIAGRPVSTGGVSFEEFVQAWLSPDPPEFAKIGRQSRFISDPNGTRIVNHLYAYEAFDHAVSFLEARIGVRVKVGQRNTSPSMTLSLSKPLQTRLREEAAAEFETWAAAQVS